MPRGRACLFIETLVVRADAFGLSLFLLGLLFPLRGNGCALRADELCQLCVSGVHVVARVLRLIVRPPVRRSRLEDHFFGVQPVSQQRGRREKRRDNRHREADLPLVPVTGVLTDVDEVLSVHGSSKQACCYEGE